MPACELNHQVLEVTAERPLVIVEYSTHTSGTNGDHDGQRHQHGRERCWRSCGGG